MNKIKQFSDYYLNNKNIDWEQVIDDFTPYLKTIINNMASSNLSFEDKEEILLDTFLILWKNRFSSINSLDSYIAGIARNLVLKKFREKKFTYNISDYENIVDTIDLYDDFSKNDEFKTIKKLFKNLKEIDIQIINLFYYSSLSTKDIAKRINISEFNVRTRLYRIRKKLRKELNKKGDLYEL